jgi:hypothetical protein
MGTDASTAIADKLLRQAGSPFSQSTYCNEYASLPRGSTRLSRHASPQFRDETPCPFEALARLLRKTLDNIATPCSMKT